MFHRFLLIYFKWHFPDLISTTFSQSKRKLNQNSNLQALLWTSKGGKKKEKNLCIISMCFLTVVSWLPFHFAQNSPSSQFNFRHRPQLAWSSVCIRNTDKQLKRGDIYRCLDQFLVQMQQVHITDFMLNIYSWKFTHIKISFTELCFKSSWLKT